MKKPTLLTSLISLCLLASCTVLMPPLMGGLGAGAGAAVGGRVTELPLDDREEVVQLIAVERGNPDNQTFVATIVNREDGSRYLGEWRCIVSEWGPNILEPDAPPFLITEW